MIRSISRRTWMIGAVCLLACQSKSESSSSRASTSKERIVSLTPNTTETLFALGAGGLMVGRSRYCDFPSEATQLPVVGGYVDPSLEAILGLRPTLVVGARGPIGRSVVDRLEARGVTCYFPSTESIAEVFAMIEGLAVRADVRPRCDELVRSIRDHLRRVEDAVRDALRPRTLLVFGQAPISVAGPGSFPDEMLTMAGCVNAVKQGTSYPTLGIETVIGLDPDLIIDATMAGGHAVEPIGMQRPGWSSVRAVQRGSVVRLDDDQVLRPGPRIARGVALLARHAHVGVDVP